MPRINGRSDEPPAPGTAEEAALLGDDEITGIAGRNIAPPFRLDGQEITEDPVEWANEWLTAIDLELPFAADMEVDQEDTENNEN